MPVIETLRSKCRDCYKCVRACPVKAIKVEKGQGIHDVHASIVEDYCLHDGKCIRECPQGAKRAREDVHLVKAYLARGDSVAASVAPSFAAALPVDDPLRFPEALRRLGFSVVQETALGAEMVAKEHRRLLQNTRKPFISSACPAVVSLIEKHYPEALPYLAPLVSPAIAHGRYLKQRFPGIRVVFIGPCVAKKAEIDDPEVRGSVDVALTFDEVLQWFKEEGVDLASVAAGDFDGPHPSYARLFPADGGLLRTTCSDTILSLGSAAVSGVENCIEMLKHFSEGEDLPQIVEMLACSGGCISGPFAVSDDDLYGRRAKIIRYAESHHSDFGEYDSLLREADLRRTFVNKKRELKVPSEDEIRKILAKSGKFAPEDELNCGACGYSSCREKAVAVFNGMADPEMCIPYMRRRAESMANLVVGATPTGVVVTAKDGTVLDMNQASERLLGQSIKKCRGKKIDDLVDTRCFQEACINQGSSRDEIVIGDFVIDLRVVYVADQELLVGLFLDVTADRKDEERRRRVAREAVERAQQVIEKQMAVAQKIAGLLGETTAETKISLVELINAVREEKPGNGPKSRGCNGTPNQAR